jgi:hypothetical protein
MEFLNPAALFGLLSLPVLVIAYLIRRKPHRLVFSSVLLFLQGAGEQAKPRLWGRINLPPILFLQLLLLALLVLALSEPVFSVRPTHVAVVLDNSASMQAVEEGRTRFALAKERIGALARDLGFKAQIDLYLTTPRLEKLNQPALDPDRLTGVLKNLVPYDIGDAPIDYDQVLGQLAREQKYDRVYLYTDHPATAAQTATTRIVTLGQPAANLAVTGFDVHRMSLTNARMQANVTVANFSVKDEKIRILLKADGTTLASREIAVAANKTATASFEGFAERTSYEVELDAQDALALDNRRFAVAPGSRTLRILVVTPRPQAAASLKSIAGINVDAIAPSEYGKVDRTGYGLEIFHYSAPTTLPDKPALFILPPESSPLVDLDPPVSNIQVSGWREPHGLTRYVNFALFRPSYARALRPQAAGLVVLESPRGPLAFAVEQRGTRYLTLGFDPLPYLGRNNLPMSIFTLNVLDWFFESGNTLGQATGAPIPLSFIEPGDALTTPAGERLNLKPGMGYFAATFHQGIYRRNRGGQSELFARNFDDLGESDLRSPATIRVREATAGAAGASVLFSFWPYLLAGALLLFLFEWFFFPRSRRAPRARFRPRWRRQLASR